MLETPHVVVGAAIATKVVNPALAIPLAFGSHFLVEKIPHWNPHLNTEKRKYGKITKKTTKIVIIDVILSLALGGFIAYQALPDMGHAVTILAASFFAALPDIIEGPYFFFDVKSEFIKKWIVFQKSIQIDAEIIPGLLTQVIVVAAALWWVFM